jgi:hypothetical protein
LWSERKILSKSILLDQFEPWIEVELYRCQP